MWKSVVYLEIKLTFISEMRLKKMNSYRESDDFSSEKSAARA